MSTPGVHIHLERIILPGRDRTEAEHAAAALATELARLLTERGVPDALRSGGAAPSLDAGALPWRPGDAPEAVGARVARALYAALGGEGDP